MRSDHTIESWLMGKSFALVAIAVLTHHRLLNEPFDFTEAFDRALKAVIKTFPDRPKHESSEDVVYYCAYIGSFGEYACNPRTLSSNQLNRMVSLEGIVTKTSLVRPKVVKSVHYNEKKAKFHYRLYQDQTMSMGPGSTSVYPTEDEDGDPVGIFSRDI
jgi:DNA replication licensing factor MCM3